MGNVAIYSLFTPIGRRSTSVTCVRGHSRMRGGVLAGLRGFGVGSLSRAAAGVGCEPVTVRKNGGVHLVLSVVGGNVVAGGGPW